MVEISLVKLFYEKINTSLIENHDAQIINHFIKTVIY